MNTEAYLLKKQILEQRIHLLDKPITNPMFGELNKAAQDEVKRLRQQIKLLEKQIERIHETP